MKNLKILLSAIAIIFSLSVGTASLTATQAYAADGGVCGKNNTFFGLPTWYKYLDFETDNAGSVNTNCNLKIDGAKDVVLILFAVLEMLLILAGILSVIFVIIGGFKYVTSQASPDKLSNAKNTIVNALIGVAIAVLASQIVAFIAGQIK